MSAPWSQLPGAIALRIDGRAHPMTVQILNESPHWSDLKAVLLNHFPSVADRRQFMYDLFQIVEHTRESEDIALSFLWEFTIHNNVDMGIDMDEAAASFPRVKQAAISGGQARDRIEEARKLIASTWGEDNARQLELQPLYASQNAAKLLRRLSQAIQQYEYAALLLNLALVTRLTNPGRGIKTDKVYLSGDVEKAIAWNNDTKLRPKDTPESMAEKARKLGLIEGVASGLYSLPGTYPDLTRFREGTEAPMPGNMPPLPGSPPPVRTGGLTSIAEVIEPITPQSSRRRHSSRAPSRAGSSRAGSPTRSHRGRSPSREPVIEPGPSGPLQRFLESNGRPAALQRSASVPALLQVVSPQTPTGGLPRASSMPFVMNQGGSAIPYRQARSQSVSSDLTIMSPAALEEIRRQAGMNRALRIEAEDEHHVVGRVKDCTCRRGVASRLPAAERVSQRTLNELDVIYASGHAKPGSEASVNDLLYRFGQCLTARDDTTKYCMQHMRYMGGTIGLQLKLFNKVDLTAILYDVSRNRGRLPIWKTDKETFMKFRKSARPAQPSDALGVYRFFTSNAKRYQTLDEMHEYMKTPQGQGRLAYIAGITKAQYEEYQARGTLNFDLFKWWKGDIFHIASHEFDMYWWHLRKMNDVDNLGWNRNQLYSIPQQLMRMDVRYWAAYALLRADRGCRLVSYPYYCKYALEKDRTIFRHMDVNIQQMVARERGALQIQGSVSLDDEHAKECTEVVPGMHKDNIKKEWARRLGERGVSKTAYVQDITTELLTKQDLKDFKTDWEAVPCKALQARITDPAIPHGSRGPAQHIRRTMLPWFCKLDPSGENFEVLEGGSFDQISKAHRDRVAPPLTPSGLANKYGVIPYAFPASVKVDSLSPLSDAMIGQRRYEDPEVIDYIRRLMTSPQQDVDKMIAEYQTKALHNAKRAHLKVQTMEEEVYGDKSYFKAFARNGNRRLDLKTVKRPTPDVAPQDNEPDEAFDRELAAEAAEREFAENPQRGLSRGATPGSVRSHLSDILSPTHAPTSPMSPAGRQRITRATSRQ